ncbi:MAG: purine-nucleoside phosphorylase [Flavobacteriaceae bacterium]|nr:purine-nucleoside phosphorylase [Flavobacteriaceae bacterium]
MSIHIEAKAGQVAEKILLPGDPLRAQWIAETWLENPICYNKVRNMLGFTGTYKGQLISVQGTGMGVPSISIYAEELIRDFGVKQLIRVGSAGSYHPQVALLDVVIAMAASTTSGINRLRFHGADFAPTASFELFVKALRASEKLKIPVKGGNVLTSDLFYEDRFEDFQKWADFGVLCVEMETAGLYTLAAKHRVDALTLLTISDSLVTGEKTTASERETTFSEMIEIALNTLTDA